MRVFILIVECPVRPIRVGTPNEMRILGPESEKEKNKSCRASPQSHCKYPRNKKGEIFPIQVEEYLPLPSIRLISHLEHASLIQIPHRPSRLNPRPKLFLLSSQRLIAMFIQLSSTRNKRITEQDTKPSRMATGASTGRENFSGRTIRVQTMNGADVDAEFRSREIGVVERSSVLADFVYAGQCAAVGGDDVVGSARGEDGSCVRWWTR